VIELAPELAEKAAQVMELNAAQLMNHPDKSPQSFAFLGLDPLDPDDILDDEDLFDEDEEEAEQEVVARPRFKKKLALGDPSEPAEALDGLAAPTDWAEPEAEDDLSPVEFPWRAAEETGPETGEPGTEPDWDDEQAEEQESPAFAEDVPAEDPVHAEAAFDPPYESAEPFEPEPAEEFAEPVELASASLKTGSLDEPAASSASEPFEETARQFEAAPPALEEGEAEYFEEEAYASLELGPPAPPREPVFVSEDYSARPEPDLPAMPAGPEFASKDAYAPLDAEPPATAEDAPLDEEDFPAALDFEEPAMAGDAPFDEEDFPAPLDFEEPAMAGDASFDEPEQPAGIDIFAEPALAIGIDHIVPPVPAEPEHRGHSLRARVVQNHQPEITLGTLVMNFLRWLFARLKQLWS
jgi:hypothetical protein